MKNFLRVLHFVWPYRFRLLASFGCALMVALLWGGNITMVYPVLTLLGTSPAPVEQGEQPRPVNDAQVARDQKAPGQNLQTWVQSKIRKYDADILDYESQIRKAQEEITDPAGPPLNVKQQAKRTERLAKFEDKLAEALKWKGRYQWLQHYIIKHCPTDRFMTMVWMIGVIVGAVILKGIFDFWHETLVGSVIQLTLFDLRNRFYRNVIHLDVNQFTDEGSHALMARFTNDMQTLGTGIKTIFGKVVAEPMKAVSCIVLACYFCWQLTLLFLLVVPPALFIMGKVGKYMKRASRRVLESMSGLYKILQESFQGAQVVKAFTMERYERRRFFVGTKDYYRRGMTVVVLDAVTGPVMEALGVIAVSGALLVGSYLVLNGQTEIFGIKISDDPLDTPTLFTLYSLLIAVSDPVRKLSSVYTRLQSGAAAADRIFSVMDKQPGVSRNVQSERLSRHSQSVEFKEVCFSYQPGIPILTNVNLKVQFGETIALVGKNGCGKSTLVGLLPRFFDPDHGDVIIDGHDLRKINVRSLRQQVGYVTQETFLFDDTIYNNIAYGNRHARKEQVESAARKAFAHDFIANTRDGYDTRIGEMGTALSGGQRQRIALARAMLRDPSILILDEATSATDLESEALIHKALREFTENRTTFLITHRLSMLEIVDRIVVINKGRIEAVGTHDELMKSSESYQRLNEMQSMRQVA